MKALQNIKYINGKFLAVDTYYDKGLYSSTDGRDWVRLLAVEKKRPFNITYGNGIYVVVGLSGLIFTSTDCITWEDHSVAASISLYDVAFGDNTFVATGDHGVIITSTDGINWQETQQQASTIISIIYDGKKFVAVDNTGLVLDSTDHLNWHSTKTPVDKLTTIIYGQDIYIAAGSTQNTIIKSIDLKTWTSVYSDSNTNYKNMIFSLAYGNGVFVAVSGIGKILTSLNGTEWKEATISSPSLIEGCHNKLEGVACDDDLFISVGVMVNSAEAAKSSVILISEDKGQNWKES